MSAGIYKIENVVNDHIYIGQSVNLNDRKYKHYYYLQTNKHHNKYLQRSYKKYGKENFTFSVLLYCEQNELTRYEQDLVDLLDPEYNICKECIDSTKGLKHSKESIMKIKEAHIGMKASEETRKKMSLASKGRKRSEESIQKTVLAHIGSKRSEETKQKMSLAQLGNTKSKGVVRSEEYKQKMSLIHTGLKHSEETKQKMSLAKKGKPWSESRRMAYNQQVPS